MWHRFFLLSIFFIEGLAVHAQNLDSLKKQLKHSATGRGTADLLYAIGDLYLGKDSGDSAIKYFGRSLALAKKEHYDSLIMESAEGMASSLNRKFRYEEGVRYFDTAISYARSLNTRIRLMHYLNRKTEVLTVTGHLEGVAAFTMEALAIARATNNRQVEAHLYTTLGAYYGSLHNYAAQLDCINRSNLIYDSLKMYADVAENYRQISVNYSMQKKYRESLHYARITDSLYEQNGLTYERNVLKIHLGIINKNIGKYGEAILLYKQALDSFKDNQYVTEIIYSNMGIAQSLDGSFEAARQSFHYAFYLNKAVAIPEIDLANYRELSLAFLRVRQLDSALHYAKKCEQACKDQKTNISKYQECVQALSDIYAAKGDLEKTRHYDKVYSQLQDSIFQDILKSNLADAETRFGVSEKNKEFSVLATENELRKVKERWQLAVLFITIIIVIVVIVAYRRSIKSNKLLAHQKQQIDEQLVQLEAASTMKARFLANMSHELRTPATLVTGMLELMKERVAGKKPVEEEKIGIAYDNSRRLQHMIEEMLDLSRVEQKADKVNLVVKEVAPVLRRIVFAFEAVLQQKELSLEYNDNMGAGICAAIDEDKFEKIINNLVFNAIKFNKRGGKIEVNIVPSADATQLVIEVKDTGVGISAEDLPFVFERFYQGAVSGKIKYEGVGIGLSLVKEFTMQLGGVIAVASSLGAGTTFTLQLPVANRDNTLQPEEEDAIPVAPWEDLGAKHTVLIAEDNEDMRYYLREVLGENLHIAEAANGKEALAWLADNTPDIIISDMMMPEMDGRELVSIVKEHDVYSKIPIITLTALADADNQMTMLRLGVDDYIVKPFNADELRIRTYNLLRNFATRRQFNEQPKEADDVVVENDDDAAALRERIRTYVLKNIKNTNIVVPDMATELLLSERQLFRLAKSLTGYTPLQLIREVRLQRAYELLLGGGITKVEDVATRVGFERPAYFSRQFLERFGKRPADFL